MTQQSDVPAASRKVVLAALSGNLAIAVTKFAAWFATQSTAMLTEAIHSLVDTGDQLLLLVGQQRSARPADAGHPFGYGMEAYFWSFIVALMIFLAGGALAIRAGVEKLLRPAVLERPWISLAVLAAAALFEGFSFRVAYREYRAAVRGRPVRVWRFLRISKDPSLFTTLLEDGAALAGLALAAIGVIGAAWLHLLWLDGAASVAIGLLLVLVAIFLANETRSLIAGEAASPVLLAQAREIVCRHDGIEELCELASVHLGPHDILLALTLRFRRGLSGDELHAVAQDVVARVREVDGRIAQVYLRPAGPE